MMKSMQDGILEIVLDKLALVLDVMSIQVLVGTPADVDALYVVDTQVLLDNLVLASLLVRLHMCPHDHHGQVLSGSTSSWRTDGSQLPKPSPRSVF